MQRRNIAQFVKYCMVGVLNTLVCLGTIFICKSLFGINPYVSNALGYTVGVLNSFLWNRRWVFRSHGRYSREAIRFMLGCGLCYLAQLAVVMVLNQSNFGDYEFDLHFFVLSGYGVATLLGNVVYTLCNFVYNRLVVFK